MNFESIEDIFKFAIEKEREAVDFYLDASREASYSNAKEAFEDFAKEERKHQELLEGFLKGETDLSDYRFKWIPDIKRSNYLVDITYEKGMPYTDMLRMAMKREEKALQLYNDLIQQTGNNDAIKVLQMLAQEEAKHKLALETLYDDHMAELGD